MTDRPSTLDVGAALSRSGFRLVETIGRVDVPTVLDVLSGRLAAYRVSNFLDQHRCEVITRNFWTSKQLRPRLGNGEDGIEAYIIGASHIDKSTDDYLRDCECAVEALAALSQGTGDPITDLRTQIAAYGVPTEIRAAQYDGRVAGSYKAVCWNNTGEYLLLPHEDLAQLGDPLQTGFEIQQVRQVMAVNTYPQVSRGSGHIKLWNVEPDEATRERLGLKFSGYPYPAEFLTRRPSLIVDVQAGDLCLINGNLVHAVLGCSPTSTRDRLLLTCFMGVNDDGELLWWT